jgi:hypothetical protein
MTTGRPGIGTGEVEQPSLTHGPESGLNVGTWCPEIIEVYQIVKISVLIAGKTDLSGISMGNAHLMSRKMSQILLN